VAVLPLLLLAAACSTSGGTPGDAGVGDAGPPGCDSARCDPGNECLSDGVDVACRRPCDAHSGPTSCAFNWTCTKPDGADKPFCRKNTLEITTPQPGQWGAPCNPTGGWKANPQCDSAQEFWCYGESPTDAHAYCTYFGCQLDTDCGPGMWCAKTNVYPNVDVDIAHPRYPELRGKKSTTTVCMPRTYCATCSADVDCPPVDGIPQVCALDARGEGRFCTRECASDTNCRLDARCVLDPDVDKKLCFPRAGACKGDGGLCSPCSSDDDCPEGYCLTQQFSPERWCSVRSTTDCVRPKCQSAADCANGARCTNGECQVGVRGTCPAAPKGSAVQVGCAATPDPELPQHQCYGLVPFGGDSVNIGCWTRAR